MLTDRRVLFPTSRRKKRTGGTDVIVNFMNELLHMGVVVHPVYAYSRYVYSFRKAEAEPLIFPEMNRIQERNSFKTKRRILRSYAVTQFSKYRLLDIRPTDIVMIRCSQFNRFSNLFQDNLKILFVQDAYNVMRAYAEGGKASRTDFPFAFATSEVSKAALESIYDGEVAHIPLVVGSGEAEEFPCRKKRQIAYFPRKREYEPRILTKAIQDFLPDWRVMRIENVSDAERDTILRESAIFLSFSQQEGFGLPPAEAMRSGALVVGYTGVGCREYMTDETSVLIEDSDVLEFIVELRKAASNFREDGIFSGKYERIRRNGFDAVNSRYSYENFCKPFRAFWNKVDSSLR